MTTTPPIRTTPRPFDLRRATGSLLLLSGSLALGLTTYWLASGTTSASTSATTTTISDTPDQGYAATTDDQGWMQAAPEATYSSQAAQPSRGTSRGS